MSLLQYVFLGVFFLFVVVLPYYCDKRGQQRIQERLEERELLYIHWDELKDFLQKDNDLLEP